MTLVARPRIDRLLLGTVTAVPEWHPEYATFEPFPVHAWLIHHPDGPVLFDTGIGLGNELIDDWYRPQVTPLVAALHAVGVEPGDVSALVLSHLHFDHCGQQGSLAAPVYVQSDELAAAEAPHYTVPQWAGIERSRLRAVDGDDEIMDGVRLLATPGHTPGHQSLVVEGGGQRVVLVAQCAMRAHELETGEPAPTNLHDPFWHDTARSSLDRIRSLAPLEAHFSHDGQVLSLS